MLINYLHDRPLFSYEMIRLHNLPQQQDQERGNYHGCLDGVAGDPEHFWKPHEMSSWIQIVRLHLDTRAYRRGRLFSLLLSWHFRAGALGRSNRGIGRECLQRQGINIPPQ